MTIKVNHTNSKNTPYKHALYANCLNLSKNSWYS